MRDKHDDHEAYLTRGEFRRFRDNHFHTLEIKVAKMDGKQTAILAMIVAMLPVLVAVLVAVLL